MPVRAGIAFWFLDAFSMRYAREGTAALPYAEFINGNRHGTFGKRNKRSKVAAKGRNPPTPSSTP